MPKLHKTITIDRVVALCERRSRTLEDPGLCVVCGAEASNIEPDARQYPCGVCQAPRGVYGAEELLLMLS